LRVLALLLCLLAASPIAAVEDQQAAKAVAACTNSANGFPDGVRGMPWHLEQAELERWPADALKPGYAWLEGRRLGWHATWFAVLDFTQETPMAFDGRPKERRHRTFAARFVPQEVIEALAGCGVSWGGHWQGEYPLKTPVPRPRAAPEAGLLAPACDVEEGAGCVGGGLAAEP
jgi:hypothetical protein